MGDHLRIFMTKILADGLVPIFTGLVATYGFVVVTLPLWILILSRFV